MIGRKYFLSIHRIYANLVTLRFVASFFVLFLRSQLFFLHFLYRETCAEHFPIVVFIFIHYRRRASDAALMSLLSLLPK